MAALPAYAQSLMDARAAGIGAYLPLVRDVGEFPSNPAGLVQLRDWDLNVSTYLTPQAKPAGFVFHGISLGKRFLNSEAIAFRYSPGTSLRFVIPPTLILGDASAPASNDRDITYSEIFALGYAHRFSPDFAAGIGVRVRREEVSDTRYQMVLRDSVTYPAAFQDAYASNLWLFDASIAWHPHPRVNVAAAVRNLFWLRGGDSGDPIDAYRLPTTVVGEAGIACELAGGLTAALSASTAGAGAVGVGWSAPFGLTLRSGALWDSRQPPFFEGFTFGAGVSYQQFEVDAGYVHYTDAHNRSSHGSVTSFDPSLLTSLEIQPYSRSRLVLSAKASFGNVRESLARIEGIRVFGSIYPVSSEALAYKPIGSVTVRNISHRPIQARVRLFVDRIMDSPTESSPSYIAPGGLAELPLMAVFNDQLKKATALTVREGDVYVSATPADDYDDRSQTRLVILGRNAWDGDSKSLRYFVTPDDPAVLRYSRDVLLAQRDSLANVPAELEQFARARVLINSFAGKIQYVNDPKLTADYVQYPAETLQLRGGDCDDMTVCFASLLSSIGLSTAFVDVVPPDHPDKSHIYVLCDTGIEPRQGSLIAGNPKRYVVRRNAAGLETIWIPLETTVAARGFDEAWTSGAQKYFDDVEIGLGLVRGWVKIVDVN